jgi:exopolyphosphatase / guanosine-5'-triphosphate,3'-diphosphate pyrophosphatase
MQLAAIDIGTNSVHMMVVRVRPDLSFEVIDSEKAMVRLGAGGLDGRELSRDAMTAAIQALTRFRRLADAHHVEETIAVATSAVREARNGGRFLAEVAEATGIRAAVITGSEEARLIHAAAVYGVDVGANRAVAIDIGGGSVELTLGTATAIDAARSFKLGVIRLTERFVTSDPLSGRDEEALVAHVDDEAGVFCDELVKRGFDRVIGTSGTILSLGAMAVASTSGTAPTDVRNLRVSAKALRRLRKTLVSASTEERLSLPGMDPKRIDLSVAGIVLLDTLLKRLGAEDVTLCDLALREGLVIDYIRRNTRHIAHADGIPDVRRRSTIELAERCNYSAAHAQQVARLALSVFDQTRAVHGLSEREREWLEFAAVMHDIGGHISYHGHHRHSHYLILNGDLRGFAPDEIAVIALIARYHRRGVPKKSHEDYAALEPSLRRSVRALSSILRLAESLDRSHAQVVTGIGIRERDAEVVLEVAVRDDAELEVWTANTNIEPFADLLGKPVRAEVVTGPRAPAEGAEPSNPARTGSPAS